MSYKNIREFITFLETKNDLLRIKVPVSQHLEIAEIQIVSSNPEALRSCLRMLLDLVPQY